VSLDEGETKLEPIIELLSAAPIQVSRKENTMSAPTSEIATAAAPSRQVGAVLY
jgi:hypothetical protein